MKRRVLWDRPFPHGITTPVKLQKLGSEIGWPPSLVKRRLLSLYVNVYKRNDLGAVSPFSAREIAKMACFQGDPDRFVKLLKQFGWIRNRHMAHWPRFFGRELKNKYSRRRATLVQIWAFHGMTYGAVKHRPPSKPAHLMHTFSTPYAHLQHTLSFEKPAESTATNGHGTTTEGGAPGKKGSRPPKNQQHQEINQSPKEGEKDKDLSLSGVVTCPEREKESFVVASPGGEKFLSGLAPRGGEWKIPTELHGLHHFEGDARFCRKFNALVVSWQRAYPELKIAEILPVAHAWLVEHPEKHRTNMVSFVGNWLRRENAGQNLTSKGTRHGPSRRIEPGTYNKFSR